ncbi:MAG: CRTAC1 family protein [Bryobacteraceae bacterium]
MEINPCIAIVPLLFLAAEPTGFREIELAFVLENSASPEKYLPETMAGGVAAFDYNNDGRPDIFFANGAALPSLRKTDARFSNRLFRNDGKGRFTDVTAESGLAGSGYSIGVAAADYDNDGNVDLFVTGVNENRLYRNLGNGKFEDVTVKAGIRSGAWSVAAGWFDFDNDGKLDLFVVNYVAWSADNNPVCKDPGQKFRVYCHPRQFAGLPNTLYRNRGDGTFEDVSEKSGIAKYVGKGMSLAFADYDGDGFPDVFVANDTVPNFLFHNRGDGTFEEAAFAAGAAMTDDGKAVSAMGVDFRDYDNDGLPDIAFTALTGETFPLFRNLGNGQFRDATFSSRMGPLSARLAGWSIAIADFNNDGWKDIFTANSHVTDNIERFSGDRYKLKSTIFLNNGNGGFTAGPEFDEPHAHRGSAVADFDGDGRLDIVVSALGGPAELWLNRMPNPMPAKNHWLDVKLIGTASNRDGIGAVVRIGKQVNQQTSAFGYASSSNGPVHFGLGAAASVPLVEVKWPGGKLQALKNVAADRTVTITEP